jgi:DNA polymerase-1
MLLIIDFLNIAYRNFFALPALTNSKGRATHATYGVIQSIRRWVKEFRPTHLAIVLEGETPQRRLELLPQYKANRPPTPELLISQLSDMENFFPLLGWPTVMHPTEEADDVGAALAVRAAREGLDVRIASNDKDFLQIVGPKISAVRGVSGNSEIANEEWLEKRWGITPGQVADFLALQGDASDNIPGVPRVGEKTALALIHRFGSVEKLLISLDQIEQPGLKKSLSEHRQQLERNLQIIRLDLAAATPELPHFLLQKPQFDLLIQELEEFEFKSLISEYKKAKEESSAMRQAELF